MSETVVSLGSNNSSPHLGARNEIEKLKGTPIRVKFRVRVRINEIEKLKGHPKIPTLPRRLKHAPQPVTSLPGEISAYVATIGELRAELTTATLAMTAAEAPTLAAMLPFTLALTFRASAIVRWSL